MRMFFHFFLLACIISLFSGCGDKNADNLVNFKINFQLPERSHIESVIPKMMVPSLEVKASDYWAKELISRKNIPEKLTSNPWGQLSPTAIGGFNCFGILIDYPEVDYGNQCFDAGGNFVALPDERYGLVAPSGSSVSLSGLALAGSGRQVYVMGFYNTGFSGPCENIFDNMDLFRSELSPPFILGQGTFDFLPGGTSSIALSASYLASGEFEECTGPNFDFPPIVPDGLGVAVDHYLVTTDTGSPTAGIPFSMSITAIDSTNAVILGFDSDLDTKTFSLTSIVNANSGEVPIFSTTQTFVSGVATSSVTFYNAGSIAANVFGIIDNEGVTSTSSPAIVLSAGAFDPIKGVFTPLSFDLDYDGTPTYPTTGPLNYQAQDIYENNLAIGGESITLADTNTCVSFPGDMVDNADGTYSLTLTALNTTNTTSLTVNGQAHSEVIWNIIP